MLEARSALAEHFRSTDGRVPRSGSVPESPPEPGRRSAFYYIQL